MLKSLKNGLNIARKYGFLFNSSGHTNIFCQIMYFLPKKKTVIQKEGGIKYVHKTGTKKEGEVRQMLTKLTEGGWGVGEMLTMADKGGRGV